jgi:hypothetical protein
MNWYNVFNSIEAALWAAIALSVLFATPIASRRQRAAVWVGCLALIAFGVTDLLELGRDGRLPLWLWGLKAVVFGLMVACQMVYSGVKQVRWNSREIVLCTGLGLGALGIIVLQRWLDGPQRTAVNVRADLWPRPSQPTIAPQSENSTGDDQPIEP